MSCVPIPIKKIPQTPQYESDVKRKIPKLTMNRTNIPALTRRRKTIRVHQNRTLARVHLAHFGVHPLRLLVHRSRGGCVARFLFDRTGRLRLLVHDAVRCNLSEHLERVEPGLHALQLDLVVDRCDGDALDVDHAAVGFRRDLLALAVMVVQ